MLTALMKLLAEGLGYDVLQRSYYSPVVDPAALPSDLWSRPRPTPGLEIDVEAQLEFLEQELAQHLHEFAPALHGDPAATRFYLQNGYYGPVDAEVLYGMVRRWKPKRMIELGSGFSSLVTLAALGANEREAAPSEYRIFDPFAGDHAPMEDPDLARVSRVPATAVSLDEFRALSAGDILFVDTTHTVKPAGDVNYLLLEVLPVLSPGVIVHVHDIFLPWEYPRLWIEHLRRHWAEQYLLQALLSDNVRFEIIFASHAVARAEPDRLRRTIPSFDPSSLELTTSSGAAFSPGAFWLRRTAVRDEKLGRSAKL